MQAITSNLNNSEIFVYDNFFFEKVKILSGGNLLIAGTFFSNRSVSGIDRFDCVKATTISVIFIIIAFFWKSITLCNCRSLCCSSAVRIRELGAKKFFTEHRTAKVLKLGVAIKCRWSVFF